MWGSWPPMSQESMKIYYKIQVENEEEIIGFDIDIFYQSPLCKQFEEKLEELVSEDEEDEMAYVTPKSTKYEESDEEWERMSKHTVTDPFAYNEAIEMEEAFNDEIRQLEL
ncbi:hypothetical protein Tco_0966260 [Tanacetum coccineum]